MVAADYALMEWGMSISYRRPKKVLRGALDYLFFLAGRFQ